MRAAIVVGLGMTMSWLGGVLRADAQPPLPTAVHQNPAYQTLGRDAAIQSVTDVKIAPGRVTTIDFSQSDEVITYVLLADPSRAVYSINAELGSPTAKTLFLRRIETLDFPGATSTWVTNLAVQTTDRAGVQRLYQFNVIPTSDTPTYVGLIIAPAIAGQQTIAIGENRTASLRDIEEGLQISVRRGYTTTDDPIVGSIQELIARVRNSNTTLVQAAAQFEVPLPVLTELARIAWEERILPRPSATNPSDRRVPDSSSEAQASEVNSTAEETSQVAQPASTEAAQEASREL